MQLPIYFLDEETEVQRNCLNAYRGVISDRLAVPRRTCTIGLQTTFTFVLLIYLH